jgi:hypothetical protein
MGAKKQWASAAFATLALATLRCSSDTASTNGSGGAAGNAGGSSGSSGSAGNSGSAGSTGGSTGRGGTPAMSGTGGTAGATTGSGGTTDGGGNGGPVLGGCPIFPADNAWNMRIDDPAAFPVDPASDAILARINSEAQSSAQHFLHPDFGSDFGIPYVVVPSTQSAVPVTFTDFGSESDPGPYPIPANAPIEAGSDAHVLVLQSGSCLLYEIGNSAYTNPGWTCSGGAKFDLSSNAIRTIAGESCPTSADAAGLSIFAGLVKYDEVASGRIQHAIRFTVRQSRQAFVRPATHYASSLTDVSYPPMGLRVRLKTVPAGLTGQSKIVATALKEYGMILADNGSNWYLSGAPNASFDDDDLNQLKTVPETAFEVVQMGRVYTSADCR